MDRLRGYRVLRRLMLRIPYTLAAGHDVRTAVSPGTGTTGLNVRKDEIIDLGMVKFDCPTDGRIVSMRDASSDFNDPCVLISEEVMALMGISHLRST